MILFRFIARLLQWVLLILLPFFLLIRLSVYLYADHDLSPSLSILASSMAVTILLVLYISIIVSRFTGRLGRWRAFKSRAYLAVFFVWAFCAYGLVYLSSSHAKSDEVRREYTQLHPILRLATGTLILADPDMVITDASRSLQDYDRMGIPRNQSSLHFKQSTGYVHAVDLRTSDRSEFRNQLLEWTYRSLGFETLRHVGTADHLHVGLR